MRDPGWRAGVVEGTLQDGCLQITICTGCFSNALFRIVASTAGCCFWTLPAFMQEGHHKLKPGRARRPFTLISHDVARRGHLNFMLIGWMILCRFLGSRPGSGYGPWRFPLQSPAVFVARYDRAGSRDTVQIQLRPGPVVTRIARRRWCAPLMVHPQMKMNMISEATSGDRGLGPGPRPSFHLGR